MAYTNNVPQGNQTIASTTDPIRNNFAFLQTSIDQEHNFDITDGTKTYHKKASMPNRALSPALPAGTNGVYFVSSGKPYFYDGTTNYLLTGANSAVTITGSLVGGATAVILAAGNWFGTVNAFMTDDNSRYVFWQFRMVAGVLVKNQMASGGSSSIDIVLDGSSNLVVKNTGASPHIFAVQVIYTSAT